MCRHEPLVSEGVIVSTPRSKELLASSHMNWKVINIPPATLIWLILFIILVKTVKVLYERDFKRFASLLLRLVRFVMQILFRGPTVPTSICE